jgi:hypothetical protein
MEVGERRRRNERSERLHTMHIKMHIHMHMHMHIQIHMHKVHTRVCER